MIEYPKIQTVYKRDPKTKFKTLLEGEFVCPEFEYLKNNVWIFTEKIDGMNIRVVFDGKTIRFGGKTDGSQIPAILANRLNERFLPQIDLIKDVFTDAESVCLYGEGYGAKIQKGGENYRPDQDFVLFDVRIDSWWLKRDDVEGISHKFGLGVVPEIGAGTLYEMVEIVRNGFNSRWGDFLAEGIVARPLVELKGRDGTRVITKVKYKDFVRGE